jgi:hypothetical protein
VKRALLIGSQTGGLSGVDADVELVGAALEKHGFSTEPVIGKAATAEGIGDSYRGLIEDAAADDAVVVYYSGHGGRIRNPVPAADGLPRWLQYIVPTDIADTSDGRARCVLAEELSLWQRQLTARTANVTVILDCCHSARMSRRADVVPKALDPELPPDDLVQRWRELRADLPAGDANPDAVRLTACGADESAYESFHPELGSRHGALTAALVQALDAPDALASNWLDALEVIRTGVRGVSVFQRPAVEGPADRLLFSLRRRSGTGVLPVHREGARLVLRNAALFGVSPGDVYALVAPAGDPAMPLAVATVDQVVGDRAVLRLDPDAAEPPPGTSAWPLRTTLPRQPVLVRGPAGPDRDRLTAGLERSIRVRPTEDPTEALAIVRVDDDGVQVLDAAEQPLHSSPATGSGAVGSAIDDVERLAMAEHVRALPSGAGPTRLPHDVDVALLRIRPDGSTEPVRPGDHLFVDDLLRVRIDSGTAGRWASVFDVGVAGAVTLLTTAEPDGVTLTPGVPYQLGEEWPDEAVRLGWPATVPATGPRPESVVVVITDRPVDRIRYLGQRGITRGDSRGASGGELDRLIDSVAGGLRDVTPPVVNGSGHRVHRFDFLLHPVQRPRDGEPAFEIDERPDPSFRLVVPRGVAEPPQRLAVRLSELTVHSNRSFLASRVRVDTMIISTVDATAGQPYRAQTLRFPRIHDGEQLPLQDAILYEGPVDRFVDVALWVSKDDSRDPDLADLLTAEATDPQVASAITTLGALAVAQPTAALVAASVGAVAVLVRTAARVVEIVRGTSIGVYRTSLLPHEGFGVGGAASGIGRRPGHGLLRAQDISFALEFVDQTR